MAKSIPQAEDSLTTPTRLENGGADPDALDAPAAVVVAEGDSSEGGKLKMIIQLVKKCLGVKDIASMRLSLPASLLEPMPNLEYWHYLDRPDLFAAINDSPDAFERMLAMLRWTFSKDLKFIRGKICKPYNSVLGEHFRAHWVAKEVTYPPEFPKVPPIVEGHLHHGHQAVPDIGEVSEAGSSYAWTSDAISLKSSKSSNVQPPLDRGLTAVNPSLLTAGGIDKKMAASEEDVSRLGEGLEKLNVEVTDELDDPEDFEDAEEEVAGNGGVRVVYLTEQISHHPPASSFYFAAQGMGVEAAGVDQIVAKVSGTTVRITPGHMNKGIFVSLTSGHGAGEEYHVTHPAAHVNGILRGSFYATMTDSTTITCASPKSGTHLRAIIEYKEESWLGKPQFLVEGCIHEYDPCSSKREWETWLKVKHVPAKSIIATFEGSWRKKIDWKMAGSSTTNTLIDIDLLSVVPKIVRPLDQQLPNESRKLWEGVTSNLLAKNFSEATKIKQAIEQRQRDIAAQRKVKGSPFVPVYFDEDISSGKPALTTAGRTAVQEELKARS